MDFFLSFTLIVFFLLLFYYFFFDPNNLHHKNELPTEISRPRGLLYHRLRVTQQGNWTIHSPNPIRDPHPNEPLLKLDSKLGTGGNGSVYKATFKPTKLIFALKHIHRSSKLKSASRVTASTDPLEEISIMTECRHKNIVSFHGSMLSGNDAWLFLSLCEAGSAADLLKLHGPFPEPVISEITKGVLTGLMFLHEKNIVHRDIKPANILFTKDAQVKLCDFGLAQRMNMMKPLTSSSSSATSLTSTLSQNDKKLKRSGTVPTHSSPEGTLPFLAPEVLMSGEISSKSDVWALGISIFNMAEGEVPHQGLSETRLMFQILKAEPPSLSNPSIWSPELIAFLGLALTPNSALRPTSLQLSSSPFYLSHSTSAPKSLAELIAVKLSSSTPPFGSPAVSRVPSRANEPLERSARKRPTPPITEISVFTEKVDTESPEPEPEPTPPVTRRRSASASGSPPVLKLERPSPSVSPVSSGSCSGSGSPPNEPAHQSVYTEPTSPPTQAQSDSFLTVSPPTERFRPLTNSGSGSGSVLSRSQSSPRLNLLCLSAPDDELTESPEQISKNPPSVSGSMEPQVLAVKQGDTPQLKKRSTSTVAISRKSVNSGPAPDSNLKPSRISLNRSATNIRVVNKHSPNNTSASSIVSNNNNNNTTKKPPSPSRGGSEPSRRRMSPSDSNPALPTVFRNSAENSPALNTPNPLRRSSGHVSSKPQPNVLVPLAQSYLSSVDVTLHDLATGLGEFLDGFQSPVLEKSWMSLTRSREEELVKEVLELPREQAGRLVTVVGFLAEMAVSRNEVDVDALSSLFGRVLFESPANDDVPTALVGACSEQSAMMSCLIRNYSEMYRQFLARP